MNIGPPFVADAKSSKPVQPRDGALDDPARLAKPAAMLGVASGKLCVDAARGEFIAQRLGVIGRSP